MEGWCAWLTIFLLKDYAARVREEYEFSSLVILLVPSARPITTPEERAFLVLIGAVEKVLLTREP